MQPTIYLFKLFYRVRRQFITYSNDNKNATDVDDAEPNTNMRE